MNYFTQADLENALGKFIVASVYDDDGDNVADAGPIASVLAYGTSEVKSFLRANHTDIKVPDNAPIPDDLKFAAVDFGCAYTARRRPDLTRAMGEAAWTTFRDAAVAKMKNYIAGVQRLSTAVTTPDNVGGQDFDVEEDAELPAKRFDNMGDY